MNLRCNTPARDRCNRLRTLLPGQLLSSPASQQETRDAGLLGRQLQAARSIHRQNADLSHHRGQGSAAQGFLQRPAYFRIAPRGDEDQPTQFKAESDKTGGIEIGVLGHPGDPSRCRAGLQRQSKESGSGCALLLVACLAGDFMDGAQQNAGIAKIGIDGRQAGGQQNRRADPRRKSRDSSNALS